MNLKPRGWLFQRLAGLFRGRHAAAALDEEVRLHLELLAADYEQRGLAPEEARRAARRAFGAVASMKDRYRDRRCLPWLADLWRDVRHGLRTMRRQPGPSIAAALTLALAIGANAALFGVINAVMLTPLPVPRPGELRLFSVTDGAASVPGFAFSYVMYEDLKRDATAFSGIALHGRLNRMRLVVSSGPGATAPSRSFESITGQAVSGNYFDVLGARPAAGRLLTPGDDGPDTAVAVVVSDRFWTRRFNRAPDAIGRSIVLNDQPFTIVGVGPEGFTGVEVGGDPDVWWPVHAFSRVQRASPGVFTFRGIRSWGLIGRLAPGVDPARAEAQARAVFDIDKRDQLMRTAAGLGGAVPSSQRAAIESLQMQLQPGFAGSTTLRWEFRLPLIVLSGLVVVVLLIACANVANLLLARATARRQEMVVRMALGSGRGRIVRQMLTESGLIAAAGAGLGLGVAVAGSRLITAFLSTRDSTIAAPVDARVFAFTAGVSLLAAVGAGLAPAVALARLDLAQRDGRATTSRGRLRIHHGIVAGQVALSVVVLMIAGLFVRTLHNLERLDTGFDRHQVTQVSLDLPAHTPERRLAVHRELLRVLGGVPGHQVALSVFGMLSGVGWRERIEVEGRTPDPDEVVYGVVVSSGFFEVTGTRLVAGRAFSATHDRVAEPAAVVNQTLARRYFGGSALGRRFRLPGPLPGATFTVIGVVTDSTYRSPRDEASAALPIVYFPALAGAATRITETMGNVRLAVRSTAGVPVEAAVRAAIEEVDPAVMIAEIRTMDAAVEETVSTETLLARLGAWFGVVALILAATGIYGVRAYAVSRRTAEIGLRLAVGATPSQVLRQVIAQGAAPAVTGIIVGSIAATLATQLVRTLLFRIMPFDLPTFMFTAVIVGGVAMAASYLPARRAMRIDPARALRAE